MNIRKLLDERKEVFKDKILSHGYMVLTDKAKRRLTEIDIEIRRLKMDKELIKEIEDRFAHVFDEVITDIDSRLEDKIVKRLDVLEEYLKGIVDVLGILVEKER